MEKVFLVITATINLNEKEALNYYLEQVGLLYKKVGAKPVKKFKIEKTFIGESGAHRVSIMALPNIEAVSEVFESEKYKTLLPYREKAFNKIEAHICVE